MYKTPEGKEILILNGNVHFRSDSPENQAYIHGNQFIDRFYACHTNLSPQEGLWEKAGFGKYSQWPLASAPKSWCCHGYAGW